MMTNDSGATIETAHRSAISALTTVATCEDREGGKGFGDDLSGILTAVAANLGGTDQMVSGERAQHVQALLQESTLEALAPHRTEPLRIRVNPGDVLHEVGWSELYDASRRALQGLDGFPQPSQLEPLEESLRDLQTLRARDELEWFTAFTNTAEEIARSLGIVAPVEVTRRAEDAELCPNETDELENLIIARAVAATPLPGSGISPDGYDSDSVALAEQQAGRMPHQRLRRRG